MKIRKEIIVDWSRWTIGIGMERFKRASGVDYDFYIDLPIVEFYFEFIFNNPK